MVSEIHKFLGNQAAEEDGSRIGYSSAQLGCPAAKVPAGTCFSSRCLAMVISSLTFFQRVSLRITPSTLIPEKSIAVLRSRTGAMIKPTAYFADGIQEEILTRLAKVADLKVISRTSRGIQKCAGKLPEIAKELGVAHILEGSVQKTG